MPTSFLLSSGRRLALKQGMAAIAAYERQLFAHMLDGFDQISGLKVYGITERDRMNERTPTAGIRLQGHDPEELSQRLGQLGIATYAGHMYAVAVIERLGLTEKGGVLRVGLSHYNTQDEVDKLLEILEDWS